MKVQLADREVWIEFAYESRAGQGPRRDGPVEFTACLLRDGSAARSKNEPAPLLARAEVARYVHDPPNRELARKAALTKALDALDQSMPPSTLPKNWVLRRFLKERRKLFWTAYLNRKRPAAKTSAP